VVRKPPRLRPGSLVRLQGPGGAQLGLGIWDEGWIAVRRFRSDEGALNRSFLQACLQRARLRRLPFLPPRTTAWRMVNAENDGLPGTRVDIWADEVHVTLDSPSLSRLLPDLSQLLQELLQPRRITLGWRSDPRDRRGGAARAAPPEILYPDKGVLDEDAAAHEVRVEERGVGFLVRPALGSDAGLFPDMRDNRRWLQPLWQDRRVLNLFAYTGAFSVFAALAGARQVVTGDLAQSALQRAKANFATNQLDPTEHEFLREDSFRLLDRMRRTGRRFDLVLADPPAFSRAQAGAFSISKDMPRLTAACLRVLDEQGLLVLACNQGSVSPRAFHEAIQRGAQRAKRALRQVHSGGQAPDFASSISFPEGRYLKFGAYIA